MQSIVLLMPWFGPWPPWMDLFLLSCRENPDVDWRFFTDQDPPATAPTNVRFEMTTWPAYRERIASTLGVRFDHEHPYKLCDAKVAYGVIHEADVAGYDLYGFGDVDVIYGRLRDFLTDDVLHHNVIATHATRVSGHLCLFRNEPRWRNAFRRIPGWREALEDPESLILDEAKLTKVFLRHRRHPRWARTVRGWFDPDQRGHWFRELHSTVDGRRPWVDGTTRYPEAWIWRDGRLTTTGTGDRTFCYLHFMNWKSTTWLPPERGTRAAWEGRDDLVRIGIERAAAEGFAISRTGFHPLAELPVATRHRPTALGPGAAPS